MDIIFYHSTVPVSVWADGITARLPQAQVRKWEPGDTAPAEYALVRLPPMEMLKGRDSLKAVFSLSAGVNDLVDAIRANPDMLPASVPLFRLEDAGMAVQMREYAVHWVLGWYRRFDEYAEQKARKEWKALPVPLPGDFTVGVLGAGVLGMAVARALKPWGFPVRCWSRSPKHEEGIASYHGPDQLDAFLGGLRVLVNMLPDTPETRGIINAGLLNKMSKGAYVLNLARGAQLVEDDLLTALDSGRVRAAALDVFAREPLPKDHPFWTHPRVAITPHSAAETIPEASFDYIAESIKKLERGEMPGGQVDIGRGY